MKKGALSMDVNLINIVELVEALAMSGTLILDKELVIIMLEGLGPKYDNFVTSFTSIPSNIVTFQELQGFLTNQE